jgi:hypothetical protein
MTMITSTTQCSAFFGALCIQLLFAVSPSAGQVRVSAFSGAHIPTAGPLSAHWNSGIDLGLAWEVCLTQDLAFRNTVRYSMHSFREHLDTSNVGPFLHEANVLSFKALGSGETIPTIDNEGSESYDFSAEMVYTTEIIRHVALCLSMGASCTLDRFADVKFYQPPILIPPGSITKAVIITASFKPRLYLMHTASFGARARILDPIDLEIALRGYTSYTGCSRVSVDAGIGLWL